MKWWMADEYAKPLIMKYPERRNGPQVRLDTEVRYDEEKKEIVAEPIRVYTGGLACYV